ncbi:MAG: sulfatase-like hydrolase/transferase [Planctomycetaceae bacterium]|nr:sulfatase-like hydrolase/transferase [Planctomycetaceae bacterium]
MNAVIITLDCLPLRLLGCYGNLRVRTPHLDRLASESIVFAQHVAAWVGEPFVGEPWWSADPLEILRGKDVTETMRGGDARALRTLREHGVRTFWRGETRDRRRMPADRPFESRAVFLGDDDLDADAAETPWAQSVNDAVRLVPRLYRTMRSPWLLWIQSAGIPDPWSAPREWLLKYAEVDAGAPEEISEEEADAEDAEIARLCDPARSGEWNAVDWKLARALCAGCVSYWDAQFGRLLAALDSAEARRDGENGGTMLIVVGGRGLTLSRRTEPPAGSAGLFSESAQTPLFVRVPGTRDGFRCQSLAQTRDLWPTLLDWFGVAPSSMVTPADLPSAPISLLSLVRNRDAVDRTIVQAAGRGMAAVRRSEELTIIPYSDRSSPAQLFHKPEDLWETLDVAASSPDSVEQTVRQLREWVAQP